MPTDRSAAAKKAAMTRKRSAAGKKAALTKKRGAVTQKVYAVMGLRGFRAKIDGFNTSSDHTVRLELPERFNVGNIKVEQKDFEILAPIARKHPKEMVEMHNAVLNHNFPRAKAIADEIGLDEGGFISLGGGWVQALVALILIIVIAIESVRGVDRGDENENSPSQ